MEASRQDYAKAQPVGRDLLRFVHHQLASGAPATATSYRLDLGSGAGASAADAGAELPPGAPVTVGTQTDYR
jgi:hypothetical protein